jgi:Na+/H+-dicarboxylate symporter
MIGNGVATIVVARWEGELGTNALSQRLEPSSVDRG